MLYLKARKQKAAALEIARMLLERDPDRTNPEDRMALIFSAVRQVGWHVEYVGEITGLEYRYVERVLQRMHDAGLWPAIGTDPRIVPLTAEECKDFAMFCDEDRHGRMPKQIEPI